MPYTTEGKNYMLDHLATRALYVGAHTAVPSTATPNEVTGGSPAYARKAKTWNAATAGAMDDSNAPVLDIPGGVTVTHWGYWTAATGGVCVAYAQLAAPESFGSQGTLTNSDTDFDLLAA